MIRYLTVAEISALWHRPQGTIRRLAHTDQWTRSTDRQKPVLYRASDVEATMTRLATRLDNVTSSERS